MSNEEKSEQLGMPIGTANARLRKAILFSLVQETKRDNCYRCKLPIQKLEEFSIEHKKPWFRISTELFWSLNNIAFSHLVCNIAASNKPWKKNPPEGQRWCYRCKTYKPIELFSPTSNRCKPCNITMVDAQRRKKGIRPKTKQFTRKSKYD